ncbi:MAG: hypothetical protein QME76_07185 [Bacillota bacterium]|nr:hypothetical protein [Bacillota bacterium]
MRKKLLIVSGIVAAAVVLVGLGYFLAWERYVNLPMKQAREAARQQQEELNKMVRHGEAVEVKPEAITIKVEKGGGDIGKTVTARVNEYTSIQIGMGFVNKPGEKLDLTRWFKQSDQVDMLYKDGQAMAVHRELRPGENPSESQPETGSALNAPRLSPEAQAQGQQ